MVEQYTDYRRFIAEQLVATNRTRRELASHLGLSESMMSQVLSGQRRLKGDQVDLVAGFFTLSGTEPAYLAALVDLENDSPRARRHAWAAIQAHQRRRVAEQPTWEASDALSDWYVGAILELAICDGFRADPRWLAATLHPPISEAKAEQALALLLSYGLLEPDDEKGLRPTRTEHVTGPEAMEGAQSLTAAALQRQVVTLAMHSLAHDKPSERHLSTMLFALPEERWPALVAILQEAEASIMHLLSAEADSPPNRVHMLGIQLVPVSLFTDTEYDPSELRTESPGD